MPYWHLSWCSILWVHGFIADVCCGRLKTVVISLCFLFASVLLICLVEIVVVTTELDQSVSYYNYILFSFSQSRHFCVCLSSCFASSFYHRLGRVSGQLYTVWTWSTLWSTQSLSGPLCTLCYVGFPFRICPIHNRPYAFMWSSKRSNNKSNFILPIIYGFLFITLLIVSRWKCYWFYTEPGYINPYKTVFNVISFVRKHKYPIDFAKERYGGPFTTEQV